METLRVYARYLAMRAKVRLAYRADFLINALGDLLVASVGLVFLGAVFGRVPHIKGWTFHEVLFTWGMAEAGTGLFFVLFQGLWVLNQRYILGGDLDLVLVRPLDPLLQVLLDNVNLEDVPVALLGVGMMLAAMPGLPPLSLAQWLLLPVFVAGGAASLAGLLTAVSAAGFRVHHRGTAIGLVYQASVFNRYPLPIFAKPLQRLLTWVLPMAFCSFFPASWYLGRTEWLAYAAAQPVVAMGLFAAAWVIWHRALGSYRSPGS